MTTTGPTLSNILANWSDFSKRLDQAMRENFAQKSEHYQKMLECCRKIEKLQQEHWAAYRKELEQNLKLINPTTDLLPIAEEKFPSLLLSFNRRKRTESILNTIAAKDKLGPRREMAGRLKVCLTKLSELKGREDLKSQVASLVASFVYKPGAVNKVYLNMVLMGPPGSGKTTLGILLGNILSNLGILVTDTFSVVSKKDFIGQYVGQTAPRTASLLNDHIEGVLFIDEAYQLAIRDPKGEFDSYSLEAMGELVNFLDKHRGTICVIAAGYRHLMLDNFMQINEGMQRRFPYVFNLAEFKPAELREIIKDKLRRYDIDPDLVSPEAYQTVELVISKDIGERQDSERLFRYGAGSIENLSAMIAEFITARQLEKRGIFSVCSMWLLIYQFAQRSFGDEKLARQYVQQMDGERWLSVPTIVPGCKKEYTTFGFVFA